MYSKKSKKTYVELFLSVKNYDNILLTQIPLFYVCMHVTYQYSEKEI